MSSIRLSYPCWDNNGCHSCNGLWGNMATVRTAADWENFQLEVIEGGTRNKEIIGDQQDGQVGFNMPKPYWTMLKHILAWRVQIWPGSGQKAYCSVAHHLVRKQRGQLLPVSVLHVMQWAVLGHLCCMELAPTKPFNHIYIYGSRSINTPPIDKLRQLPEIINHPLPSIKYASRF